MEKKLTAQGPNNRKSYTVTLPIEWVKEEKLDKTRSVELSVVGNNIIIKPHTQNEEKIVLNSEDYSNSIVKVIPGFYRRGIDEVKLIFNDTKHLEFSLDLIEKSLLVMK